MGSSSTSRPLLTCAFKAFIRTSADFHGIDSYNFHGVWTGDVVVRGGAKAIDINFDLSWSDVALSIDGASVASWSNSGRSIRRVLEPGSHSLRIEYFNNWHTTSFFTSFTTNTAYAEADAKTVIAPLVDADTQILYVGCYESADLYNDSTVTLGSTAPKVFLFVSSYTAMNWTILNPNGATIVGIGYGSYSGAATVTADAAIPTFEVTGLAYAYSDFTAPTADITNLTGRPPDYTFGAYGLTDITVAAP